MDFILSKIEIFKFLCMSNVHQLYLNLFHMATTLNALPFHVDWKTGKFVKSKGFQKSMFKVGYIFETIWTAGTIITIFLRIAWDGNYHLQQKVVDVFWGIIVIACFVEKVEHVRKCDELVYLYNEYIRFQKKITSQGKTYHFVAVGKCKVKHI
jgi:hypothetical protein